jgi:hypothetical protein
MFTIQRIEYLRTTWTLSDFRQRAKDQGVVIPGAGTVIGYDDQQAVAAAARFEQRKQLHQ